MSQGELGKEELERRWAAISEASEAAKAEQDREQAQRCADAESGETL